MDFALVLFSIYYKLSLSTCVHVHTNLACIYSFPNSPQVNGATFSYGKLQITNNNDTSAAATTENEQSPEFLITFKEKDEKNMQDLRTVSRGSTSSNTTLLPVYTNAKREQLLCEFEVATTENVDTVLLSGAALIVGDY